MMRLSESATAQLPEPHLVSHFVESHFNIRPLNAKGLEVAR